MKGLRTIAVLALLQAGLAQAGIVTGTNDMPVTIRNLMDSAGYPLNQNTHHFPGQTTPALRNLHFVPQGPFARLVVPVKKNTGWSLWKDSSFKNVGSPYDQTSSLARYEYDIFYSFYF